MNEQAHDEDSNLPAGLGKPAIRALHGAGYTRLEHLTAANARDIASLHGVGPNAMTKLRQALAASGMAFADER